MKSLLLGLGAGTMVYFGFPFTYVLLLTVIVALLEILFTPKGQINE